jgi:tryptophanyl-tRNA synthetase
MSTPECTVVCRSSFLEQCMHGCSDSDSDLSDIEDEFVGGDWTPEALKNKLAELEALLEKYQETREQTVCRHQ